MVKHMATGIALANLDGLDYYQAERTVETDQDIGQYVYAGIRQLPWFSGVPVRCLLAGLGVCVLVTTGHHMDTLARTTRQRMFSRLRGLPLFDMVNKLVVTLTYLRLFDTLPMSGAGPE